MKKPHWKSSGSKKYLLYRGEEDIDGIYWWYVADYGSEEAAMNAAKKHPTARIDLIQTLWISTKGV